MTDEPWFKDDPEYVPEWDVLRYKDGTPITITYEQGEAILHALHVMRTVCILEHGASAEPHLSKSRLLGRMLYQGLPPTKTKPPRDLGAPEWSHFPGGDPFLDKETKSKHYQMTMDMLGRGKLFLSPNFSPTLAIQAGWGMYCMWWGWPEERMQQRNP